MTFAKSTIPRDAAAACWLCGHAGPLDPAAPIGGKPSTAYRCEDREACFYRCRAIDHAKDAGHPIAAPRFRVDLPPELAALPDGPTVPLDLDAFERWAATGEGDPWTPGE